ncbi:MULTISPECIES: Lrp/AsnC family transcriptional regulator [Pseudomonas]|jgi:Lrp/AsnC family transcriptional regulator|uniref:Lrp/AsnC family transcriptional regulator n=1 Tax=Pseudomonas TaxID=286 RepID=UPI001CF93CBB|nr:MULTISPECIES: Lrp/AsnC family transcriptional regulator [Pseudomonas]
MDKFDRAILEILQDDCTLAIGALAERIGLGTTACWRRIQKLEEEGILRKRVALLDRSKLNIGVTVFVSIKTNQHSAEWLQTFHARVAEIVEVVELYRMAGDTDYLLKMAVPDIAGYDAVYKQLIQIPGLSDISSSFAMEQIKYTTAMPLRYLPL